MGRDRRDQKLLLHDLDAVENAMEEHLDTVRYCMAQSRELRELIASGVDVNDALMAGRMAELRKSLTGSIKELEDTRHRSRLSLVAVGLREGMSIGDFSRIWGISRQLASRYAREARTNDT